MSTRHKQAMRLGIAARTIAKMGIALPFDFAEASSEGLDVGLASTVI